MDATQPYGASCRLAFPLRGPSVKLIKLTMAFSGLAMVPWHVSMVTGSSMVPRVKKVLWTPEESGPRHRSSQVCYSMLF